MKRFFMYCIVIIGTVFVGLAFYMFAKNNEVLYCTIPQGDTVYLNVGESLDNPIIHTKPDKRTTIEYKSDNSNLVSFNEETKKFEARLGGTATITITPSNENFGPFTFTVRVGDGSNDNPYFISNAEQMLRIGAMNSLWTLDDSYEVVSNIDFKETWVDGNVESWKPIGDAEKHFTGNFNGGTKTISNLVIDETCTSDYVGLFGYVESGAKIERVTLSNPQIKVAGKNVGAIAGYNEGSITRCKVVGGEISSSNTSTDAYVGGIAGVSTRVQAENEIAMCSVDGVSLNSGNVVAGIVGKFTSGVISNCKAYATLADNKDIKPNYAGGLVGEIASKSFSQTVGSEKTFTYNSLIQTNLIIPTFGKDGEEYNATNVDVLIAKDTLTGDSETDYVGNLFYSDSLESTKASKLTRQGIEEQSNFKYTNQYSKVVSWDFSGTWSFEGKTETDSIGPYIVQDGVGQTIRPLRNGSEINKSNATDVIGQLMVAGMNDANSKMLEYTYVITEDVEVDVKESFAQGWTPIGNVQRPFSGTIYGQSGAKLTLKNINVLFNNIVAYQAKGATSAEKTAGIFGCTSHTASISDIVVANMIIYSDDTTYSGAIVGKNNGILNNISVYGLNIKNGSYVGGIAGYNNGEISRCLVGINEDQYGEFKEVLEGQTEETDVETQVVADGKSTKYVGGIVGYNANKIENSSTGVTVSGSSSENGSYVGGAVGFNAVGATIRLCRKVEGLTKAGGTTIRIGGVVGANAGAVEQCYSELSELSAGSTSCIVGGVAGENQQGTISKSYFSGTIKGYYVGGVVGNTYGGSVEQCYTNASISESSKIGGITYHCEGTVKNCYFEAMSQIQFANGKESDNVFSGLAVSFPEAAHIENCYVSTRYGVATNGSVSLDVNEKDTGRSFFVEKFWGEWLTNNKTGTLRYNVINIYGMEYSTANKLINNLAMTWGNDPLKFYSVNISGDGKIDANTASYFTSTCRFDSSIWNFDENTPILKDLNLSGAIDDEFVETSINVALAEGTESNITLDGTALKVTGFVAENPTTITLDVTTENTEEVPTATLVEGDCVEVGAVADGKFTITVKAIGNAKIQLTLTDGTILELTVEIVE